MISQSLLFAHTEVYSHRVKLSTPGEFFSSIEQTDLQNLCTWSGELYLEMHNGTYTTQSKVGTLCCLTVYDGGYTVYDGGYTVYDGGYTVYDVHKSI